MTVIPAATDPTTSRPPDPEVVLAAVDALYGLTAAHGAGGDDVLAGLRRRHPEHRFTLLTDVEAYDGSAHHDLVVRQPGAATVSLSVAAGPGLPWPLRGVTRAREYDLFEINGRAIAVGDVLADMEAFTDRSVVRAVVNQRLIAEALEEDPIEVRPADLQRAADDFRRAKGLRSAAATRAWLADRGWSEDQFAVLVHHYAQVRAVRRRVAAGRIEAWCASHPGALDVVVAAIVATDDADGLQRDPLAAIVEAKRAGRQGEVVEHRVGDLPEGLEALAIAPPGAVVAVAGPAVAVVLDRRPTPLDPADPEAQLAAERALFDEWLTERRRAARVTWLWGDDRLEALTADVLRPA